MVTMLGFMLGPMAVAITVTEDWAVSTVGLLTARVNGELCANFVVVLERGWPPVALDDVLADGKSQAGFALPSNAAQRLSAPKVRPRMRYL